MEITKERLDERLEQLRADRAQTVANVNALDGAIQDTEHWLGVLAEEEQLRAVKEG